MVADPILAITQMIDSNIVGLGVTFGSMLIAGVTAWTDLRSKNRTSDLKIEILTALHENAQDIKSWVNGSFMRAATVEAKLETIEGAQEALQKQIDNVATNGCARINTHLPGKQS